MKTEHELANALRTMMSEMPLDDISVTSLTQRCRINRKTFYYHFHDIYDLLTQVFLDESISGVIETKDINQLLKVIFDYYLTNNKFIDATLNSAGKDLFEEFIYNICYTSFLRFIVTNPESKKLHQNDRKYIARFYAYAYSNSIIYYFSNYKNKTLAGLINSFAFEGNDCLNNAITRINNLKGKTHD